MWTSCWGRHRDADASETGEGVVEVVWVAPRPWKMLKSELIAAAARCSIRSRSVVDEVVDAIDRM